MASQYAVSLTDIQEETYRDDMFCDDSTLLDEVDSEEFSLSADPANEDLWDMLDISTDDWQTAQADGFFIF